MMFDAEMVTRQKRKILAMHLYALVLLVYGTFSKHKGGLSEIELSAPIFGNAIILEN